MTNDNRLQEEFRNFLEAEEMHPPKELRETLLSRIQRDLNPSFANVFLRVLALHGVLSLVTLSICSQFGLQFFPLLDLMNSFMAVAGHTYCMAFCGALFVGASSLSLSFVLTPEQVKVLRKNSLLQFSILSFLSLGVFLFFGAEILLIPASLWLVGALTAGILSVEIGWNVRAWFRKRVVYGV